MFLFVFHLDSEWNNKNNYLSKESKAKFWNATKPVIKQAAEENEQKKGKYLKNCSPLIKPISANVFTPPLTYKWAIDRLNMIKLDEAFLSFLLIIIAAIIIRLPLCIQKIKQWIKLE